MPVREYSDVSKWFLNGDLISILFVFHLYINGAVFQVLYSALNRDVLNQEKSFDGTLFRDLF